MDLIKGFFSSPKFFQSNKCVCFSNCISTQHVIWVSSVFFGIKSDRITVTKVRSHFEWQQTITLAMAAYLFKVHVESFQQKDSIDKIWFFTIIFYCTETENRRRSDMHIFPKIVSTLKRYPLKVTSNEFLFRKESN